MMKDFINTFMLQYYNRLNNIKDNRLRGYGFKKIFEFLHNESLLLKPSEGLLLIETGSARPGGYTLEGDGQCTFLLDEFCQWLNNTRNKPFKKSIVYSVDISKETSDWCNNNTSDNVVCINDDSIKWLWSLNTTPNLIYLDSYDVCFNEPIKANLHHLKELCCVCRLLGLKHEHKVMIAIDDCYFTQNDQRIPQGIKAEYVGKGYYVRQFMENIGAELIHDGYQLIWKMA